MQRHAESAACMPGFLSANVSRLNTYCGRHSAGVRQVAQKTLLASACLPWIAASAFGQPVQKFDRVTVVVKQAELRIGRRVVGTLPYGEEVSVSEIKDGWYWISKPNVQGWIRARDALPQEAAFRYVSESIRRQPTAEDYALRARLRRGPGQIDLAIADLTQAIRLDPTKAQYYGSRGIEQYICRQFDKAIADYSEAIRLEPQNSRYFALRANSRREKGDVEGAIADYSEAIRLNPRDDHAFLQRARLLARQGDYEHAVADYDEAIRLQPYYPLTVLTTVERASVKLEMGNSEQAIKELDEAVRLSAEDPWIRDIVRGARAMACLRLGEYDRAIEDLERIAEQSPRQRGAYALLAWVRATCPDARYRDGAKAVEDGKKAVDLSKPPVPVYTAILAAAYAETGDFVQAIQWQKQAIEQASESEQPEFRKALESYDQGAPYRPERLDESALPKVSFNTFIQ